MAKKKIQLQDANGNVLHPLTLGECVTMSNGENLDTLMSKSQMFTPTITQDKSMFKVGTGIEVDYSANVKDGAYESLMFKGKSLVNLITSGEMRAIANGGWVFANSNIRVDMLKPLTDYTLITYVLQNTLSGGSGFAVGKDGGTANGLPFCSLKIPSGEVGIYKLKMRTQSEITGNTGLRQQIYNNVASGQIVFKQVLLEGDYTTRDIPYFTGLCDSKMPILRNMGKNLIPLPLIANTGLTWVDGVEYKPSSDYSFTSTGFIKIQTGVYYTSSNTSNMGKRVHCYDEGKRHLGVLKTDGSIVNSASNVCTSHTFKIDDKNVCYIRLTFYGVLEAAQLEESSTATSYEDHKTNILRTSEEIVLRSLPNGVCDTYNARTGEYVQRIGEKTLNGSENWSYQTNYGSVARFNHMDSTVKHWSDILCDKMIKGIISTPDLECINIHSSSNMIQVQISTDKLSENTATGFKQWLSQNPLTVQYELAEPVTSVIKPSTMTPFAYQNGHAIVESGFEGQSLLPEIEYSVVTGRTGQVTQNTKVLRQQEQQIISLEELLLTQVVQMEYERTLLQFDYELQMMMLG